MTPQTVLKYDSYNGTYTTGSMPVPRNPDGTLATNPATGQPYLRVVIACAMADADAQNAANSCRIVLKASRDNGSTYDVIDAPPYDWTGGISTAHGILSFTTPGETLAIPDDQPPVTDVRVDLDTLGRTLNMAVALGFE